MKYIYRLISWLFFNMQHEWSRPYGTVDSGPLVSCLKCHEEYEQYGEPYEFCRKWYKNPIEDESVDFDDLPF